MPFTLNLLSGRLEFSSVDGLDDTGKFSEFISYGTRSFSMYEITDSGLTRIYDRYVQSRRCGIARKYWKRILENIKTRRNSSMMRTVRPLQ